MKKPTALPKQNARLLLTRKMQRITMRLKVRLATLDILDIWCTAFLRRGVHVSVVPRHSE